MKTKASVFEPARGRFRRPQLVAIDLDGTLVDSALDLHAAVNAMQEARHGPPRSEAQVRNWVGNGIDRLVERAISGALDGQIDAHERAGGVELFRQAYAKANGQYSQLYDGVMAGLGYLQSLSVPLVCVTNKSSRFAAPLLEHFAIDQYFSILIGGDTVSAKKPDPMPLLHAAKTLEVDAEQCLMIGDSIHDIEAARAAQFAMIGVSYGYNHGHSLRDLEPGARPDAIIDSMNELAVLIE